MTVLVTGAIGFVGTHIAAALAEGHEVVAADLQPHDPAVLRTLGAARERISFAPLDVRDASAVRTLIQARGVRQIVHAAAITAPDTAAGAPASVGVNLVGAINVLDAALEAPTVERVLVVSSSGVYAARAAAEPLPEDAPLDLTSLYTIAKVSAERLAARYAALSGKPMAAVRLPAVYGPFERPRPSRPHTSALRRLMDALAAGQPVRVTGPEVARDWTYAAEIGAGVRALLEVPRWSWPVYNVSNGLRIPFREVVDAFARRGLRATWVEDPDEATLAGIAMRPDDARAPLATTRLEADTGYRPRLGIAAGLDAWRLAEPLP
jgi:nucleoside-diphosphate-sugar epimerase